MTQTTFVRTVSLFSLLLFAPNCGKDDDAGFGGGGEPAEMDPNQGGLDGGGSDGDATPEDSGSTSADTGSDDGVGDGGEDGSADAGDDGGDDGGSSVDSFSVTDFVTTECPDDGETTPLSPSLDLSYDESGGYVQVNHNAHQTNCCAEFRLTATGSSAGEVTVVYEDVGPECNCVCGFDLSYRLVGLPSGDWQIRIPDGLSGTVTIP